MNRFRLLAFFLLSVFAAKFNPAGERIANLTPIPGYYLRSDAGTSVERPKAGISLPQSLVASGSRTSLGSMVSGIAASNGPLSINDNVASEVSITRILGSSPSSKVARAYIDVTTYGAMGDGKTDDTAAIQAAINAACVENKASIFFPPSKNVYKVVQTQSYVSAAAPIFVLPCGELHFFGLHSNATAEFGMPPQAHIYAYPGIHPNPGPVFGLNPNTTLENLDITGYNEAVQGAANDRLLNVSLTVSVTSIGTVTHPNTPLLLFDTLWFYMRYGALTVANSTTVPVAILLQDNGQTVGQIHFEDFTGIGGGFLFKQVNGNQTGIAGGITFDHILLEDSDTPFFSVTDDGTHHIGTVGNLSFNGSGISDGNTPYFMLVNSGPGSTVTGVSMVNNGQGHPFRPPALAVCAGSVRDVFLNGNPYENTLQDCRGNLAGDGASGNSNGLDYFQVSGVLNSENTGLQDPTGSGTLLRAFKSGSPRISSFATVAVDSRYGYGLGSADRFGPDASVVENSTGSVDIQFAKSYPPTGVTVTPTTGGHLVPGTYWYWVTSATSASNCAQTSVSAPSPVSSLAGTGLKGPHNANIITWTLPVTGTSAITGFCVLKNFIPSGKNTKDENLFFAGNDYQGIYLPGAKLTSYTDKGFTGCCSGLVPVNQLAPAIRFTPNSIYPTSAGALSLGTPSKPIGNIYLKNTGAEQCLAVTASGEIVGTGRPCFEHEAKAMIASDGPKNTIGVREIDANTKGIDFPDIKQIPFATCGGEAGGYQVSVASTAAVKCRRGKNNRGGYVAITDASSSFVQFTVLLPEDWDPSSNPYIGFQVASADTHEGRTIIPAVRVSCAKGDGSTTDDVAFSPLHASAAITLNNTANQFWSNSTVQLNSGDMAGCVPGAMMIVEVSRSVDTADTAYFYGVTLTIPRSIQIRAN